MAVETAKQGIEAADNAITLFDKVIDRVIPFKAFSESLNEMGKYREYYSTESAALIDEIKKSMLHGMDAYSKASKNVYEWAGSVVPLLTTYIKLFTSHNSEKAAAQKHLLITVLGDGVAKMNAAQELLGKSSLSFSEAAGKLGTLHTRFAVDFDEHSEFFKAKIAKIRSGAYTGGAILGGLGLAIAAGVAEGKLVPELKTKMTSIAQFYRDLKEKLQKAFHDIDDAKKILRTDIGEIFELKVQTEETNTFLSLDETPELRDTIVESAQSLIAKCNKHLERLRALL